MDELIQELKNEGVLKSVETLRAFESIDRADFVPKERKGEAYENYPLPIGEGQTISQPYTVAFMLDLLEPKEGHNILEVGSGSGWQTAMLAHIVGDEGHVYAMEIIPELSSLGKKSVTKYPEIAKHVKFFAQSAEDGLPKHAPFDRIIAAASIADEIPKAWKNQLKIGGKIVTPIKNSVWVITKIDEKIYEEKEHAGFVFVPFVEK